MEDEHFSSTKSSATQNSREIGSGRTALRYRQQQFSDKLKNAMDEGKRRLLATQRMDKGQRELERQQYKTPVKIRTTNKIAFKVFFGFLDF